MLNVICIMGRIVHNPEVKYTEGGNAVTNFSVAVERNRANAAGQRETDFFDVVAWRNTAEFVCKYFDKGSMIAVNGTLNTRTYNDKNGNKRKAYEIVADNVHFCGSKSENAQRGDADDAEFVASAAHPAVPVEAAQKAEQNDYTAVVDDELPF